ncbi:hypothetical protein T07_2173 [Trichinella nelsoni]|uniref:Uncharacterized protein n=1 Tax=Trichinella nelsoni TaxID=6336 RepID=A0A0V0RN52_9BILA|nr:hypothetical protein T07_2173 [Trichinella nelsoni]
MLQTGPTSSHRNRPSLGRPCPHYAPHLGISVILDKAARLFGAIRLARKYSSMCSNQVPTFDTMVNTICSAVRRSVNAHHL